MPVFTTSVERALTVAFQAHAKQVRKASDVPYIAHPVHVALILARAGADDVTIQAGILHDVVEDCEGWTIDRLRSEFGDAVAETVEPLTEIKGRTWEQRKQDALDHVPAMTARSAAVKAADKTHNMRSLWISLTEANDPGEVWRHFTRSPEVTIDYAESLVTALATRLEEAGGFDALVDAMKSAFDDLATFRR